MENLVNKVVVLGGGTSGLVSALVLKSIYNNLEVEIVKSKDIGIIGVGEGSTEHWTSFMDICGISVYELIKETDATFKTGIKFTNWNGDSKSYFHSIDGDISLKNQIGFEFGYLNLIRQGKTPEEITLSGTTNSIHYEPLESTVNQFHFNTQKLNDFLIKKCIEKNISITDAIVVDTILDSNGNVETLITEDNTKINADFFIDSSGFRRVIHNKLGAKWISVNEYLPMNAAIAFPTERLENIPSHTESNAMSSGWMWRIPTQERFGNGYVYCNDFLSFDEAVAEAQSCFNEKIEIAKDIKFDAGYVDKFWIKNCVAVGLSGSFVEPLEASSIGTSIQQSIAIANLLNYYRKNDVTTEEIYNKEFTDVAKNIVDFVQLHYITKRQDTDFWKSCNDLKLTDFNKNSLDFFKRCGPMPAYFTQPWILFKDINWLIVMHGLDLLDIQQIDKVFIHQSEAITQQSTYNMQKLNDFHTNNPSFTHREALEILKNRSGVNVLNFS